jgi:type IV pilus assembly protein PilN
MRISINLATRPYEDLRSFFLRWGLLLVFMVAITAGLVYKAFDGWRHTRDIGHSIAEREAAMSRMDREISNAQLTLNQPNNKTLRDQSEFLNGLIARKAFSWTEVFSNLEQMMPARLHVVSIQPELDDQNQLELKMTVSGESRERALELLRKMEESRQFRYPKLVDESTQQQGRMNFQIEAVYIPSTPGAQGAD